MYRVCWLVEGRKKSKSFQSLEFVIEYLNNFVYNGEWIEHNNQKLDINVEDYTAKQISLF